MKERTTRNTGLLVVMLLLAILPFFVLCAFVHPSADDYSMVWLVRSSGYWQYQLDMYQTWTGRFTANLLEGMHPMRFGALWMYRLIPALLLLLLYHSLFFLFKTITEKVLSKLSMHLCALIALALYLNIFPSTAEGIYWFPGAVEYLLAGILSIYTIVLLLRTTDKGVRYRWLNLIPAAVAVLALGGLNEVSLALLAALLFAALLYLRIKNRRNEFSIFLIFVLLAVAGITDVSAPGNYIRMSVFTNPLDVTSSLLLSLKGWIKVVGIHFQSPSFLIVSLLFVAGAGDTLRKPEIAKWIPALHPLFTFCFTGLLIFALYLPGALGMGLNPPMRVHATISLAFILLWFFDLAVLISYMQRKGRLIPHLPRSIVNVLIAMAFILTLLDFTKVPDGPLVFRGNIAGAYYDLFFSAPRFNADLNERYDHIRQRKFSGDKMIHVKKLQTIPRSIFFIDIEENAADWKNTDYAHFFDVDSVRIESK